MNFIFFLGGHDAEMLEIREILKQKEIPFYDKNLKWGAKLSDYKDEINNLSDNIQPVFIELKPDISYPENSILIDHHDSRAGKKQKTSLEQTAELLNIKLNRHQQLISINDKAHIKGMKEFGASDDEIKKIRRLDRQAQGVTKKDEMYAERSIKENLEIIGSNAAIITTKSEKTSAVIDNIYDRFEHTIILSPDGNSHYFGPGYMIDNFIKYLEILKKEEPDIEYWYGGTLPDSGFLGTTKTLTKEQLKKILFN